MSFINVNTLSTRENVFGSKRAGQIVAVPSGKLDKVSLYLEPKITDAVVAAGITVTVEVYSLDMAGLPTGAPLSSDTRSLSDITVASFINFRLLASVPTIVAIVLRCNGTTDNNIAWRYVSASAGNEELLISSNNGASWTADPTRKFAYRTFTLLANAIDTDQQTALIQPGTLNLITDNTNQLFTNNATAFIRTAIQGDPVTGDAVEINFGDFVVTLVVDQSGSMTWNDKDNLRFQFLKSFASNIDAAVAAIPTGSTATYQLIKFRGRRIGKISLTVEGAADNGFHFDGVRVVRKIGTAPTNITDGVVVFEGNAEQFVDDGSVTPLVSGNIYHYSVYPFARFGQSTVFGTGLDAFCTVVPSSQNNTPPFGVANFLASIVQTTNLGVPLTTTDTDFGYREVHLSWLNPSGFNYDHIMIVRRDDRMPSSPNDGVLIFSGISSSLSYIDTFGGTRQFVNGVTYFYRIFSSVQTTGVFCLLDNAPALSVDMPIPLRPWESLEPPANVPPMGFDVSPPLPPTVSILESNGEIQLSWTAADTDTKRFQVYYDPLRFPIALDDTGTQYDGTLLFNGTGTSFIHRFLENGQPHYYVIISVDSVGNASSPVKPLISGRPPKPNASATVFFPPDPVVSVTAENIDDSDNMILWTNPKPSATTSLSDFYFGDSVRVAANVSFLDNGNSQNFFSFEFLEVNRSVSTINKAVVDPAIAIQFSHAPSLNASSIAAVIETTPLFSILNSLEDASITLTAALRVRNRQTGDLVAEVRGNSVTIKFHNPFELSIKNEPTQKVSRRVWTAGQNDGRCTDMSYEIQQFSGVYVLSGDPFFAVLEAKYRGQPLSSDLNVDLKLLNKDTGLLTTLVQIPQTRTAEATFTISPTKDETVDRSGNPTGEFINRSIFSFTLPASNIAGDLLAVVNGTFNGYVRTTTLEVHYEPILNVDLNLTSFIPDGADIKEQSAFVYLAPFDAPDDEKNPVADFTITEWSVRRLCNGIPEQEIHAVPASAQDAVPGIGVKAFTHGGVARGIFWGPATNVSEDRSYEFHVKVQANGMSGEGFGMLTLSPPNQVTLNKIFLRHQGGFDTDTIFADGVETSVWEVLAHPENDTDVAPTDTSSGQTFVNAVLSGGGHLPPAGLDENKVVTMSVKLVDNSDNGIASDQIQTILDNIKIATNLTGPLGRSRSANASIQNGKAVFTLAVDAQVPKPSSNQLKSEADAISAVTENDFYKLVGIQFQKPQDGAYLVLTAVTTVEVNGQALAYYGGGSELQKSAPPCFLALKEPLILAADQS